MGNNKGNKMNRKQIGQEWERLNHELFENRPEVNEPYPSDIIRRRELLLFAQVHLGNIMEAQNRNDKEKEDFETEMYHITMSTYYNWDSNEHSKSKN